MCDTALLLQEPSTPPSSQQHLLSTQSMLNLLVMIINFVVKCIKILVFKKSRFKKSEVGIYATKSNETRDE